MEQKAKISVIVVTYNQEATIAKTLESLLSQKIDVPFEIVIGDDASTDGTEMICRKYAEAHPDRIRYFRRAGNMGLVKNYYQCIEDCQGDFLADCAGDDFWIDDDKLRKEYEVMISDPEVSIVHTDWRCVNLEGTDPKESDLFLGIDRTKRKEYPKGTLTPKVLNHDPEGMIHLCTAMFRKDMLMRELKANPSLFISDEYGCEDFQIEIALAQKGKVVYLPDVTLNYRVYEDSISHTPDYYKLFRRIKGNLLIAERMRRHYGIPVKEVENYYAGQLDFVSAQVFHSGSIELEKEYANLKSMLPPMKLRLKTRIKEWLIPHKKLTYFLRKG